MNGLAVPERRHDPATDDPIDVLLVDDNEEWATFLADDIETREPAMQVTVAGGANEAMLVLRERDGVDCVVADYRMPEVDGIQLLDRVRERWPKLPYVLVTAEGSEEVAAAAIDAGVTDYLVKEPGTRQTAQFTKAIEAAVERYRLRQRLAESEHRYRTVIEQIREGIGILRDGRLVFCNERFADLVGVDRPALRDTDFVQSLVHPEDRRKVRAAVADWQDGDEGRRRVELRVETDDDTVRHCECTGRGITHESEPAALVSVRDVTDRKRREREREWERDLNRTVQELLVESSTRTELESAVAEQLCEYGYSLAWIGEMGDGRLLPRVVEGAETDYVEGHEFCTAAEGTESEPSVWAVRMEEPKFVQDFRALFETPWRDAAIERGFRSGAALPLVHDGIPFGVLAVYHEEPDRYDGAERQLLTDLADTVAFAIHSLEAGRALSSDRVHEATLEVRGEGYYLMELVNEAAPGAADAAVSVEGTAPNGDGELLQYLRLDGVSAEAFRTAAAEHRRVDAVAEIDGDETIRFQVTVSGTVPEVDLASLGAVVRSTSVTRTSAVLEAELPAKRDRRSFVEVLEERYGSATMLSCVEAERDETARTRVDTKALTEKQATALEAAFHHGYFEQPRRSSATEVAESLGIAHSTFLQHLRTAQQKLFESLYD